MRHLLLVIAALAASPALAQRLSFPDFTGPGAAAVRTQLVGQLCESADCLAAVKVTTKGKPDLKKAKRESLQYFVTGAVVKKGKGRSLELAVLAVAKGNAPRLKKSFPLEAGQLSAKSLRAALDLLSSTMGQAEPSEPKPAPPPPTPDPVPQPVEPVAPVAEEVVPPPAAEPIPTVKPRKAIFLAIEVGADVVNRQFSYLAPAPTNLSSYSLAAYVVPQVKVEFSPLALVRSDQLAGLGLDVAFGFAPYLKSSRASSIESYPTSALRFDGAVRWRLTPISTYALAIVPFVGVRLQSFTVGAPSSGERLVGLPNLSFFGLRAGLGAEVPIVPDVLILLARFAVLPVFSSGEIVSSAYFPTGSTFGLEAGAGVAVQLAPFLQVRLTFEYLQYGLTFTTQPTDPYVGPGATDRYLGGNAGLRLQF